MKADKKGKGSEDWFTKPSGRAVKDLVTSGTYRGRREAGQCRGWGGGLGE